MFSFNRPIGYHQIYLRAKAVNCAVVILVRCCYTLRVGVSNLRIRNKWKKRYNVHFYMPHLVSLRFHDSYAATLHGRQHNSHTYRISNPSE